MSKTERQSEVQDLAERLKSSPNLYVTDFTGLNVARMTDLRRQLRQAGARYVVVKNTLAQRALVANDITTLNDHLKGPTGLVLIAGDPLGAAKVLGDFAKANQKPQVKAGLVDGRTVDAAYIKRLGELPSRDTQPRMIYCCASRQFGSLR